MKHVVIAVNWPTTEFRPHFFEVGPRQIFSLTPNEVNKTIIPCCPFHGHGIQIFYPTRAPMLYRPKCYKNVLCLLGYTIVYVMVP